MEQKVEREVPIMAEMDHAIVKCSPVGTYGCGPCVGVCIMTECGLGFAAHFSNPAQVKMFPRLLDNFKQQIDKPNINLYVFIICGNLYENKLYKSINKFIECELASITGHNTIIVCNEEKHNILVKSYNNWTFDFYIKEYIKYDNRSDIEQARDIKLCLYRSISGDMVLQSQFIESDIEIKSIGSISERRIIDGSYTPIFIEFKHDYPFRMLFDESKQKHKPNKIPKKYKYNTRR